MKVIFAGTPAFGVPALVALRNAGHDIPLVVSQPDQPAGRGRKLLPTPIKKKAHELGLELFQPENINADEAVERIASARPDVMVVAAFGQILKKRLLAIPARGCVNIHTSLLPRLRGAAPIQRAIMEGYDTTGITTMMMNSKMDAGDILRQVSIPLTPTVTAGALHDLLAEKGATLLVETLEALERGTIVPATQDHASATYAPKIEPAERLVVWSASAIEVDRKIRGLSPTPGAYTVLNGKRLLLLDARVGETATGGMEPGTVCLPSPNRLAVQTGSGTVSLLTVKPEGKGAMSVQDWMRGARIHGGERFGE